jgi:hypothetical protein
MNFMENRIGTQSSMGTVGFVLFGSISCCNFMFQILGSVISLVTSAKSSCLQFTEINFSDLL